MKRLVTHTWSPQLHKPSRGPCRPEETSHGICWHRWAQNATSDVSRDRGRRDPAAAPPHAMGGVRGGLCQAPHSSPLGVIWWIVRSKGAACSPAAHDVRCCWTGAAAWGSVAPRGWRQGDGCETGGCGRLGGRRPEDLGSSASPARPRARTEGGATTLATACHGSAGSSSPRTSRVCTAGPRRSSSATWSSGWTSLEGWM
jgi:hypothetical protein